MILRFGEVYLSGKKEYMHALLKAYPGLKKANPAALVSAVTKRDREIVGMRRVTIDGLDVRIARIRKHGNN